jgi:hypothetical protein
LIDCEGNKQILTLLIEEELRPKAAALSESMLAFKAYNRINDEMT